MKMRSTMGDASTTTSTCRDLGCQRMEGKTFGDSVRHYAALNKTDRVAA
jgi:hypothetical protein